MEGMQRKGGDKMSSRREKLLAEIKSLLADMTEEECRIVACAVKIYMTHHELSPEECVERAKKEAVQNED